MDSGVGCKEAVKTASGVGSGAREAGLLHLAVEFLQLSGQLQDFGTHGFIPAVKLKEQVGKSVCQVSPLRE
ncbi:hypothetical protein ACSFA8_00710 [Variovorax sp. RT4R15]|uniref:hypothetical protein n=1 Tax=Variovorax sp. RT4R15 TaxID=3443737 RepID=UPI003F452030